MNFLFLYFFSYFLSYFGYLLGKATEEEHKEVLNYLRYAVDFLLIATYSVLAYIFRNHALVLFLLAGLILVKIASHFHKKYFLDLHNVGLFSVTIIFFHKYLYVDEIYLTLFPILVMIFDNSFHKFNWGIEAYKFVLAAFFLILFYAV